MDLTVFNNSYFLEFHIQFPYFIWLTASSVSNKKVGKPSHCVALYNNNNNHLMDHNLAGLMEGLDNTVRQITWCVLFSLWFLVGYYTELTVVDEIGRLKPASFPLCTTIRTERVNWIWSASYEFLQLQVNSLREEWLNHLSNSSLQLITIFICVDSPLFCQLLFHN